MSEPTLTWRYMETKCTYRINADMAIHGTTRVACTDDRWRAPHIRPPFSFAQTVSLALLVADVIHVVAMCDTTVM